MSEGVRAYLLVVGLHAEEDGVGGEAGQAPLQVRLPPQLLRLGVQVVERAHRLLKLRLFDLESQKTPDMRTRTHDPLGRQEGL